MGTVALELTGMSVGSMKWKERLNTSALVAPSMIVVPQLARPPNSGC